MVKREYKKLEGFQGKYLRVVIPIKITEKLNWKGGDFVKMYYLKDKLVIERVLD